MRILNPRETLLECYRNAVVALQAIERQDCVLPNEQELEAYNEAYWRGYLDAIRVAFDLLEPSLYDVLRRSTLRGPNADLTYDVDRGVWAIWSDGSVEYFECSLEPVFARWQRMNEVQ